MATIEQFFLDRYEALERERDGLRARVAELERAVALDADHGEYGVVPGGRVRAVRVRAASRYDFPDSPGRCRACVEALERGGNPTVSYYDAVRVEEREFPWSFILVLPGEDPKLYGVSAKGDIEPVSEDYDPQDPEDSLDGWVADPGARDCLEVAARGVALRNAREHLGYVEEQERRRAERDKEKEGEDEA